MLFVKKISQWVQKFTKPTRGQIKRTKHISLKNLRYNKQFCKGGKITSPIEIIY